MTQTHILNLLLIDTLMYIIYMAFIWITAKSIYKLVTDFLEKSNMSVDMLLKKYGDFLFCSTVIILCGWVLALIVWFIVVGGWIIKMVVR